MSKYQSLPEVQVINNLQNNAYKPYFFHLGEFSLSSVEFLTRKFNTDDVERELLQEKFSFAFLRDGELRTINAYDTDNRLIQFSDFASHFKLKIKSSNIFKSGKYLSRIFRPIKYGRFFRGLDVYVNNNPDYKGSKTDGLSLISLKLAKSLGWDKAVSNNSAQFTLLYKDGLVKGNCIISDKIEHDIIIYTKDNIKKDISLDADFSYVSLEPLKLSKTLKTRYSINA